MKDVKRILLGLALNRVERAVDDALGNGFLALIHQAVHELREHQVAIFGVGRDFAFLCTVAAGHWSVPSSLLFSGSRLSLASLAFAGMTATRSLRPLCRVDGAALFAVFDALGIEDTAKDMIAHARQVLDAAA